MFALILLTLAIGANIVAAPQRARAALRSLATLSVLVVLGFGLVRGLRARRAALDGETALHSHGLPEHGLGHSRTDLIAALGDEHEQVRASAAAQLGALHDGALLPPLLRALSDPAASVKEQAADALAKLARPEATPALRTALAREDTDEWVHLRVAEALARCGGPDGIDALVAMAQTADAKLVRAQAQKDALALLDGAPTLRGDADQQAAQLAAFWAAHREQAHWAPAAQRFAL
jgi:HEAT repeats